MLVLALRIGGMGLLVSAMKWVLIIATVLFVVGALTVWAHRDSAV